MSVRFVNDTIFVCRDCKYANMCGDPDRVASCRGKELIRVQGTDVFKDTNGKEICYER